jgi:RNA polymerase sigma-70 factor (ECF subfamily)
MPAIGPSGEDVFEEHREALNGIAYRILGSHFDAEDAVQDAWLRWSATSHEPIDDPKAFLVTVTTRLAIDRLRRARTRREVYVGTWLPEPIATGPDLAGHAALAESVELAMLVVLETLTPLQRAVFVLREAFGLPYSEIAAVVQRDEAAVRQVARRARADVDARRPRFDPDRAHRREITERFLTACASGDIDALTSLLAANVTLTTDSGGKARAPRRVIAGVDKVSRFLMAAASLTAENGFLGSIGLLPTHHLEADVTDVNAAPAIVVTADGRPILVMSVLVADDRIDEIYLLVNPEKLAGMSRT